MSQPIFLPQTSFPMKGQLPKQEPLWLQWWTEIDLYGLRRQSRKEAPLMVLHDGPPFSNGHIHLGHALNKILKDVTNRWYFFLGRDVSFIPGWDCHGLPIEAKVEEGYRKDGREKQEIPNTTFRRACRDFALEWVNIQQKEFQRLGVLGDWENRYLTMAAPFEAQIMRYLLTLVEKGYVYQGYRPVLWSPIEQTALAEAEVEYRDMASPSIYVAFPVRHTPDPDLQGAHVVIWTTTPWSLMGNRAICYQKEASYGLIEVQGRRFLVAQECLEPFCQAVDIGSYKVIKEVPAAVLEATTCAHPLWAMGYAFPVPLLPGDHVTTTSGTGFVHTAPGHGPEDFLVGQRFNLDIPETVAADGTFVKTVPGFAGQSIWKVYPQIRQALEEAGMLVKETTYHHSYPHSWRSKTPLIYRATPQWFITLDPLREKALQAIDTVTWVPASGQMRLRAMIEGRQGDWCISRQRWWGVPLPLFQHVETGAILIDPEIFGKIVTKAMEAGADFWFTDKAWEVLEGRYNRREWKKVEDIVDVWFESGITHEVVLKDTSLAHWPADIYFEGSDQHRGWFQSSLLTAIALEGTAPYRTVITHGFLLDEHKTKMSKSVGNTMAPEEIISALGADVLRLWVVHEDYQKDLSLGPTILERVTDIYMRLRNTLRFLLGGMAGLQREEGMALCEMPLLEQWIHHRLYQLHQELLEDLKAYDFQAMMKKIHIFCSVDLSSFYFDICKDSLYCDNPSTLRRRALRTTFLHIFVCLTHWLAPFLCFTSEEAWHAFCQDILGHDPKVGCPQNHPLLDYLRENGWAECEGIWSIHLSRLPVVGEAWREDGLENLLKRLREIRSVVTGALEEARSQKYIKSSLQAAPILYLTLSEDMALPLEGFADLCITSAIDIRWSETIPADAYMLESVPGVGVTVQLATGQKCSRCWKILPEVEEGLVCQRCQAV